MDLSLIRQIVISRYENSQKRLKAVIMQLNDEDMNWRPNEESNSIANLIVHLSGNIHERFEVGILGNANKRDRDAEFDSTVNRSKEELLLILDQLFTTVFHTFTQMTEEDYYKMQKMRDRDVDVTNLEVIITCETHLSEHLGQVLYIAKLRKGEAFETVSIPKNKPSA